MLYVSKNAISLQLHVLCFRENRILDHLIMTGNTCYFFTYQAVIPLDCECELGKLVI